MNPLKFEGHNVVIAEDQEEYQSLPAYVCDNPERSVITCWELTDEDIEQLIKTRRLWLLQLTFGGRLQPLLPTAFKTEAFGSIPEPVQPREPLSKTIAEAEARDEKRPTMEQFDEFLQKEGVKKITSAQRNLAQVLLNSFGREQYVYITGMRGGKTFLLEKFKNFIADFYKFHPSDYLSIQDDAPGEDIWAPVPNAQFKHKEQ